MGTGNHNQDVVTMTQKTLLPLLLLFLINYVVLITPTLLQSNGTILSSSGIVLCSSVKGYGKYTPKDSLVVKVGERVYFYNQIELKATKVNNRYKIHVTWTLTIYNPFGMLEYNSSVTTGLRTVDSEKVEWCAWFSWTAYKIKLEGKYRVILRILDELSGDSLTHEISFNLIGGIPKTLRYDMNITVTLHNKQDKSAKVTKFFMVVIPTVEPYQRVIWGPNFNIKPSKYVTDPYGNKYAVFENLEIPPKSNFTIVVRYVIMVYVTFYRRVNVTLDELRHLSPDLIQYTKPEKYIESDAEEIVREANEIASRTDNVYELCALIANFTSSHVKYTLGIKYDKGALWVYKNKKGKCGHFARLYVALARALGIPAKTAYGIGFLSLDFSEVHVKRETHTWALIYIPGLKWVPVEPQHGYNKFGLAPYYHILMASDWYRIVEMDGYRLRVKAYTYFYKGEVGSSIEIVYKVTPIRKAKKTLTIKITSAETRVYAGKVAEIKGRLSVPLNTVLYVTVIPPDNVVYSDTVRVVKGEFILKVKVPAKREAIGTWRVKLTWPGDEEYNLVEKEVKFLATSKKSRIELSVPREVMEGYELLISGKLDPPLSGELIFIELVSPNNVVYKYNVTTTTGGRFSLKVNTEGKALGTWIVKVRWSGGERDYIYDPCLAEARFELKENVMYELMTYAVVGLVVTIIVIVIILKRRRTPQLPPLSPPP